MSENEYKKLVLAAFDRELQAGRLSQELVVPTAGSLKAEAVKVCGKRFDAKDERVLGSFFTAEPGAASYLRAIQNCDYQIFRPLSTFLSNREKGTTFKNIQLLAWLMDFKPRPFHPELITPPEVALKPEPIGSITPGINAEIETRNKQEERKKHGNNKLLNPYKGWLIGIAVLLAGLLVWRFLPKDNNCMYWDNDHYVATSCNVPRLDTPLIAFNDAKLRGFRRIKRVDTLTGYSVGKLWWVRVGDSIEVFTAEGRHPLYPDKKLKKVTDYVVNFCRNRRK